MRYIEIKTSYVTRDINRALDEKQFILYDSENNFYYYINGNGDKVKVTCRPWTKNHHSKGIKTIKKETVNNGYMKVLEIPEKYRNQNVKKVTINGIDIFYYVINGYKCHLKTNIHPIEEAKKLIADNKAVDWYSIRSRMRRINTQRII